MTVHLLFQGGPQLEGPQTPLPVTKLALGAVLTGLFHVAVGMTFPELSALGHFLLSTTFYLVVELAISYHFD